MDARKFITAYIETWKSRCYEDLPDDAPLEIFDKVPSYKKIALCILKNDYKEIGYVGKKSVYYDILKKIELKQKNKLIMKKEITPEEKQAKEDLKIFNRRFAGFKRTIKNDIELNGLASMELKLQFLKEHPSTKLPKHYFNYDDTLLAFESAIREYKESLPEIKIS